MPRQDHRHGVGVVRREFLQVGFSGWLGLSAGSVLAGRSQARALQAPKAKSVVLVFLTGGLGHLDSWDLKPDAPEKIRGEFKPVATKAPGVFVCEHLPGMAARANQLAIVRSISHPHTNHLNATHQLLTGHAQPGAFFDKIASRDDFPCYAGALDVLRPSRAGVPTGVMLPTFLMEGPLTWPGQHAGFLGPKHDPWQIKQDPNHAGFREENLRLPDGFSVERLNQRQGLLDEVAHQAEVWGPATGGVDSLASQRTRALELLLTGRVGRAFDLAREDPKTRDRYGRHMFGQSLLLACRLVEAGVPVVQVNMGRVQTWDTHEANFKTLKERLLPPTDRGIAALLDDLSVRGLLDETLVVIAGEFGRTPRIGVSTGNNNTADGRDHWSSCFSAVFAGAGVRGGQTIGQSDKIGAYPATPPHTPADIAATIYDALGVDPGAELRDRLGRPMRLCTGRPIHALFSGA